MPFDGLSNERQQYLLDKLDAVSELLSSEDKWCKRRIRGSDGSRCLFGALIDANARWLLYRPLIVAAREVTGKTYFRIEAFNDDATTTYAQVQVVIEQTRVTLLSGTAKRSRLQDIAYHLQHNIERIRIGWGRSRMVRRFATLQ